MKDKIIFGQKFRNADHSVIGQQERYYIKSALFMEFGLFSSKEKISTHQIDLKKKDFCKEI